MRPLLLVATLLLMVAAGPAYADVDPVGEWPLRPRPVVVAGFDPPAATWGAGHRGVDLLGSPGQRVRAALPGRVAFVGTIAGRGVMTVDHGDTRTTYEPVAASRSRGEPVAAGDVIGTLMLPGSHCLPRTCLHWGWLRGDTYLDPLRLVGAGPVRLLPLAGLPVAPLPPAAGERPLPTPYAGWQPLLRLLRPGVQP
jgi:murein DD-endopeptidase MepM/ murein hydrolase activator NlpD